MKMYLSLWFMGEDRGKDWRVQDWERMALIPDHLTGKADKDQGSYGNWLGLSGDLGRGKGRANELSTNPDIKGSTIDLFLTSALALHC